MTSAETGSAGECVAITWLRQHGFSICAHNWRSGRYELDIVAQRDGILHFVEVKTRRATGLTPPEAAATPAKFRALRYAAEHYMAHIKWEGEVQFDLAAVDVMPDGTAHMRFIENAMETNW